MSKKTRVLNQESPSLFIILPIAFVISVVPLIVFLKVVPLTAEEIKNWYGQPNYSDFFNYYKSQWLIIGTVFAVIFYLIHGLLEGFNFQKGFIYIPTGIYALMIILSTVFSKYPIVALRGFVARFEGMWVLLCYLALMLLVYNLVKTEKQIKFLLGALLISSSIIGIIGLFQFLGMDLFRLDFGKKLILPEAYHKLAGDLDFRFKEGAVYSTFSNTNYIGSYMSLLLPISFFSLYIFNKLWQKVSILLLFMLLLVNLVGSKSSAGMIGLCVSILLTLILLRKIILKRFLLYLIIIIVMIGTFIGVNYVLKGEITNSIIAELETVITKQPFYDLKDIIFRENIVTIVDGEKSLTIENRDLELYFYDTDGQELAHIKSENNEKGTITYTLTGEQYKDIFIKTENNILTFANIKPYAHFMLQINKDSFSMIGLNGDKTSQIIKPPTTGFDNNEKLGSSRGYIWSRSIPLLKNAIFIGYGSDTFAIAFPQNDYIGKIRAFDIPHMIVDKAHNMYLQTAINTGLISLAALLVLLGYYTIQSLYIYLKELSNCDSISFIGAGIFVAITGYLFTSFFNDSVVGISPIFYIMLGIGFVCKKLISDKQKNRMDRNEVVK